MTPEKADALDEGMQESQRASHTIATIIRTRSEAGQLMAREEIFHELQELRKQNGMEPDKDEHREEWEALLNKALMEHEDLKALSGKDGVSRYYSARFITEPYALILLRKEGDPLLLIAETVREQSAVYPRPVPLEMFSQAPFELTRDEILMCLQQIAEHEDYKDIARTRTSSGTVYLYSTSHLEPGYASGLAEWFDVGQFENP